MTVVDKIMSSVTLIARELYTDHVLSDTKCTFYLRSKFPNDVSFLTFYRVTIKIHLYNLYNTFT